MKVKESSKGKGVNRFEVKSTFFPLLGLQQSCENLELRTLGKDFLLFLFLLCTVTTAETRERSCLREKAQLGLMAPGTAVRAPALL